MSVSHYVNSNSYSYFPLLPGFVQQCMLVSGHPLA